MMNLKMWLASVVVALAGLAPPAEAQLTDSVIRVAAKGIAAEVAAELDTQMQTKGRDTVRTKVEQKLGWLRHILWPKTSAWSSCEYLKHSVEADHIRVYFKIYARLRVNIRAGFFDRKLAAISTSQYVTTKISAAGVKMAVKSELTHERKASLADAKALDSEIVNKLKSKVIEANRKLLPLLKR